MLITILLCLAILEMTGSRKPFESIGKNEHTGCALCTSLEGYKWPHWLNFLSLGVHVHSFTHYKIGIPFCIKSKVVNNLSYQSANEQEEVTSQTRCQ